MKHFAKHRRQLTRMPKNMAKSIRLAIKQSCNEHMKEIKRNKNLTVNAKRYLLEGYVNDKAFFGF